MENKAQLITSSTDEKSEARGKWHKLDDVQPFIMGIQTGDTSDNIDAEMLNSLISGVPTPWARAKLFWYAFHYLQSEDPNIVRSSLVSNIFPQMIEEWKGLIAVIAIFPDRVKFSQPIYMDNSSSKTSERINDLSSSFGRMLFEDFDLWSEQKLLVKDPDTKPFIHLIYYKDKLIGATSPFSIVFPGIDYSKLEGVKDISWYKNGKFENPTPYLSQDQKQKVFSFLNNLAKNIKYFEKEVNLAREGKSELNLKGLKSTLRKWRKEINSYNNLKENIPPAKYDNLNPPFKTLLASEQAVYFNNEEKSLTFIKPDGVESRDYYKLSDLQNLLIDSDTIVGWFESTDEYQPLSKSAVHYLRVKNELSDVGGDNLYFAIPLSQAGINIFKHNIGKLLDSSDTEDIRLEASVTDHGSLQVEITVKVDGQLIKLNTKEYKIEWEMGNKSVILWPNFTSDNWNAYYLYSEFPKNTTDIEFIPFFKQEKKSTINIGDEDYHIDHGILKNQRNSFVLSNSKDDEKEKVGLEVQKVVKYPLGQVPEEVPVYEISKSNKPIAGLSIELGGKICGYLLLKESDEFKLEDFSYENELPGVTVSIDFGSNNTCAYYSINDNSGVYPVSFSNHRVALVGVDNTHEAVAQDSELLFFQNAEGYKGQIKSWLHEHHPLARVNAGEPDEELQGGVPVNEKNIHIKNMDKYKIKTQAGTLHYNMKWLSDKSGLQKKRAFLKTIWLQICADLYGNKDGDGRFRPTNIVWSHPGAMSEGDVDDYKGIFENDLPNVTPIITEDQNEKPKTHPSMTESEAVCGYALSNPYKGLTDDKLFLGIDIGGSTSDILVLANVKKEPQLLKQSSVRLAAGVFFDAIINSKRFKEELYNFHDNKGRKLKLNVLGIGDLKVQQKKESAPFYLNSIFDQLQDDGFEEFYQYIGRRSKFVFSIPSFVTGLLLYYAGMLVSNAIKKEKLEGIKKVDLFGFGKGGRLFHWLESCPGKEKTKPYLQKCFRKGFREDVTDIELNLRSDIKKDNKSEVAIGLVSSLNQEVGQSEREKSDIFGEKGISLFMKDKGEYVQIDSDQVIESEHFYDPRAFTFPDEPENFNKFLDLFLDFVGPQTEIVQNTNALKSETVNLKEILTAYLSTDSEWIKANKRRNGEDGDGTFDYRFPIIIAEGLCFLEKILIPKVFNESMNNS